MHRYVHLIAYFHINSANIVAHEFHKINTNAPKITKGCVSKIVVVTLFIYFDLSQITRINKEKRVQIKTRLELSRRYESIIPT